MTGREAIEWYLECYGSFTAELVCEATGVSRSQIAAASFKMRELGITYEHAIPQSLFDQWWLFNCEHGDLPKFITEMKCDDWMVKQYELPEAYKNA